MNDTLKMLKTIIDTKHQKLTNEEISIEYKDSLSPALFALVFTRVYKIAIQQSQKFFGLTEADICSFTLEKLDLALIMFDDSNGSKFSTFFTHVIYNKFREETESLSCHKRKVIFNCNSYDKMVEDGFDKEFTEDYSLIMEAVKSCNLTDKELAFCELAVDTYTNTDIANILNVSKMTISNIRKSLKTKILPLCY